jgi:flagellar assembly protein FliH
MKQQALRKPKFLQNIDTVPHVVPIEFTAPKNLLRSQANDILIQEDPLPAKSFNQEPSTPSFIADVEGEPDLQPEVVSKVDVEQTLANTPPTNVVAQEESAALNAPVSEVPSVVHSQVVQHETPAEPNPPTDATIGINENIATEKMIRLIEHLKQANQRLAEEARSTALEIGFQVAQRILEKEVTGDVSAMMSLVRSALRESGDAKILRISLHPKDHDNITKSLEEGQFREISLTQLELVPDATLERGDVLVDTDFGQIDGRIETRLKEIKTVIDDSNEGEPYGTL